MNVIFTVILVSSLIQEYAAADLQSIQNANPLNVDLSNPSETGIPSNGDAEVDEHKLGGYRPLYPPYFLRDTPQQKQQEKQLAPGTLPTYYDKEYYTRGSQYSGFDDRLDRGLRLRPSLATPRPIVPPVLKRDEYARGFPSYQFKANYENHGFVQSSYTYTTFRFPNT